MEKKKMFTRKKVTGILSVLLVAAFLLGGTFAFVDFNQHKTNFVNGRENVSVTLNDSYKPPADWKEGQALDKKVSVTNTDGNSDPVFVKVQFKEYFEMSKLILVTDGDDKGFLFATYADGPKKGEFMTWADAQAGGYGYTKYTITYVDGTKKDFALTKNAELKNGIYGKEMYIPSVIDAFGNAVKANYPTQPHETQDDANLECNYPIHLWEDDCDIHNDAGTSDIHDYISWGMSSQIMTMDAWVTAGKNTGDFWVVDTDGWAYWANPLQPGEHTTDIMESIKLDRMPGKHFEYYIHIDMQATTVDQLDELKGATAGSEALIDELRKTSLTLPEIIAGTPAGGTFEADGVTWRILKKNGDDMLIITDYVYGFGTPYNSTEAPAGTKQNTYSQYNQSNLYSWVNDWYAGENCESLREYAMMPSHFEVEQGDFLYWRSMNITTNLPRVRTSMGAKATGTAGVAFTLSVSEVNQYGKNGAGTLNEATFDANDTTKGRSWWLRSAAPGAACLYAAVVNPTTGIINYTNVNSTLPYGTGVRPALWISISE